MPGVRKPTPIEVFEDNMAGAAQLIGLTKALLNTRPYRMRKERRETVGTALNIPKRDWDKLDWVESPDAYVILKPDADMTRKAFTEQELRPLLRQAVVAVAAAVESYVAEKTSSYIGDALDSPPDDLPDRLKAMAVSFGDVMDIEARLKRRRWGYRELVRQHLIAEASSSPSKIGIVFSTVGKKGVLKAADGKRGVRAGTSERQLKELSDRRNRIAHTGDRVGRGHATLDITEVEGFYANTRSIVEALEAVL
jgi:hypothetical protein